MRCAASTNVSTSGSRRSTPTGSSRASRRRPPKRVAAHYLCELAGSRSSAATIALAQRPAAPGAARSGAVPARRAAACTDRGAASEPELAARLLRRRSTSRPRCCRRSCRICCASSGAERRDAELAALVANGAVARYQRAEASGIRGRRRRTRRRAPLRPAIEARVHQGPDARTPCGAAAGGEFERVASELGALLAHAERYRCSECGFAGRSFYWHCPACQSWDSFESYAIVKLR